MYVHSKMAWPPATYRIISRNHQSGPQPELDIWWRHPKFQHGAQTKGHDPGSLFSSLLHLEMTFSHSTLGVAPLNDEEALECEKMATDEVCVFCRGKTAENGSVSAQRSTWQGAKHLKIERCVSIFWTLKKFFLKSTRNLLVDGGFVVVVQSIFIVYGQYYDWQSWSQIDWMSQATRCLYW